MGQSIAATTTGAYKPDDIPMVATGQDMKLTLHSDGESEMEYTGMRSPLWSRYKTNKERAKERVYPKVKLTKKRKQHKKFKKKGQSR